MLVNGATSPGNPSSNNEDWFEASSELIVVLDGATARTDTGCTHGIAWFASMLGAAIQEQAANPTTGLADALTTSIKWVAALHPDCDLTHPGTPSAAVAIVRFNAQTIEYLVLGDVSIVVDTPKETLAISDDRVSMTALSARQRADSFLIGSAEKHEALLEMKHGELASRNQPGGYWIAANNPDAAQHALTGEFWTANVARLAVMTDGAARLVNLFGLITWNQALDLLQENGPGAFIEEVRKTELSDTRGQKWPRNKPHDDATAVYAARQEAANKKSE